MFIIMLFLSISILETEKFVVFEFVNELSSL